MAILTNENDLTHIVRTTAQWENTVDKYEVIPEGVLCVEFTPKNKTNIKIGDGHKIFRDLPYVTGIDISKYYTKEETDNRIVEILDEKKVIRIKGKLGDISELPTSNNIEGDVWFVKLTSPSGLNSYKEYVWFENKWELFGSCEDIDISKFATKEDVNKITKRIDDYVADGSIHKHANKDILDQTTAVFDKAKDDKLASLKNYDDTELKKWVSERAHTHPNKDILDQTDAVFDKAKDEQLENLEDIPDRVQSLENIAHTHDNKDVLDRTTAAFTKEQAIQLLELVEGGGGGGGKLEPATRTKLGGVKIGKPIDVQEDGTISLNEGDGIIFEGAIADGEYDLLEYIESTGEGSVVMDVDSFAKFITDADSNALTYARANIQFTEDIDQNIISLGDGKPGSISYSYTDGTLKTSYIDMNMNTNYIMHNPRSTHHVTELSMNGNVTTYDDNVWTYYLTYGYEIGYSTEKYTYSDKSIELNKSYYFELANTFRTEKYCYKYGQIAFGRLPKDNENWFKLDNSGISITGRIYETENFNTMTQSYFGVDPIYSDFMDTPVNIRDTLSARETRLKNKLMDPKLVRFADIEIDTFYDTVTIGGDDGPIHYIEDLPYYSYAFGKLPGSVYDDKNPKTNIKSLQFFGTSKYPKSKMRFMSMSFNDKYQGTETTSSVYAYYGLWPTYSESRIVGNESTNTVLRIFPVRRRKDNKLGLYVYGGSKNGNTGNFYPVSSNNFKAGPYKYSFNLNPSDRVNPYKVYDGTKINVKPATSTEIGGVIIGKGLSTNYKGELDLDYATKEEIGGIKLGDTLTSNEYGVVNVDETNFTKASKDNVGVVQIGNGIDVNTSGLISVDAVNNIILRQSQSGDKLHITKTDGTSTDIGISSTISLVTLNGLTGNQVPTKSPDTSVYPTAAEFLAKYNNLSNAYIDTKIPITEYLGIEILFTVVGYNTPHKIFLLGDKLADGNVWGIYWQTGDYYFINNGIITKIGFGPFNEPSHPSDLVYKLEFINGHVTLSHAMSNYKYFDMDLYNYAPQSTGTLKILGFENKDPSEWGIPNPVLLGPMKTYNNKSITGLYTPVLHVYPTFSHGFLNMLDTDNYITSNDGTSFAINMTTDIFAPPGTFVVKGINASKTNKGVVQIGEGINVSEDGVISVSASAGNYDAGDGIEITESDDTKTINVKYGECLTVNDSNELEIDINSVILNCIPDSF